MRATIIDDSLSLAARKSMVSGAWSDRPELAKLLKRLDQGDVLIVTRLDRLARSTRDLLNILDAVGKAGAGLKRGVKFGRPTALTPHQRREAMQRLANGEAQADVARSFNVSQATISRSAAPSFRGKRGCRVRKGDG
jgi:DNA invertase Pin-like site-specific DNA recombinase